MEEDKAKSEVGTVIFFKKRLAEGGRMYRMSVKSGWLTESTVPAKSMSVHIFTAIMWRS